MMLFDYVSVSGVALLFFTLGIAVGGVMRVWGWQPFSILLCGLAMLTLWFVVTTGRRHD